MAIRTIRGGSDAFDAFMYPAPTQNFLNYIQHSIATASEKLGDIGRSFVNGAKELYERFNSDEAREQASALLYQVGANIGENVIQYYSPQNFANINMMMQYWAMENPMVRELYNNDMCYGFQDTYNDPEPGVPAHERSGYLNAMSGMLQFDEEDEGYIQHFSDSSDDEELTLFQRLSILDTWASAESLILNGIDPTDPELNEL